MKKIGNLIWKTILITLVAMLTLVAISVGIGLLIGEASKDCFQVGDQLICEK